MDIDVRKLGQIGRIEEERTLKEVVGATKNGCGVDRDGFFEREGAEGVDGGKMEKRRRYNIAVGLI